MENENIIWQVEVSGTVYEAQFGELGEWIYEGSLQPGDKVRKGSLRWTEARRVPALATIFENKEKGVLLPAREKPVTSSETNINASVSESALEVLPPQPIKVERKYVQAIPKNSEQGPESIVCKNHPEFSAYVVCSSCESFWCKSCPNSYGGSVRICSECGSLCNPIEQVAKAKQTSANREVALNSGFGISDLSAALAYPFRFKFSLLVGGAMFTFFSLGQSAAGLGGIFLVAAALFCVLLANMLSFGVLANVVNNFATGQIGGDFMPSFEDFSLWEDVVHPFFLSIGVYIVSFGPMILTIIIGTYIVMSSASSQAAAYKETISSVPGTEFYAPDRTAEQSSEVKELLSKVRADNAKRLTEQSELMAGNTAIEQNTDPNAELAKAVEEVQRKQVEQYQKMGGASGGQTAAARTQLLSNMLGVAAPVVVVGFLAFLWGLFFMPAACAVAGYTRSFLAVVNPTVGLDTIRRLGLDYVKILLMCGVLFVLWIVVMMLTATVLSPFDLPRMGNIPAKAISFFFGFYISIVFSCILGFALYKASDRLKLAR